MTFFHGTTFENWEKIQQEGVLWGKRPLGTRCTYLAVLLTDANQGGVVLAVEYEPKSGLDNYSPDSWQVRVYTPIPLAQITRIEEPWHTFN